MTSSNPFDTPATVQGVTDDPFATPRTTFPDMDWIVGRLILCYPTKVLRGLQSKDGNGTYDAITADVHVLDGATITEADKPIVIPGIIDSFRFTNSQFVDGMEKLVGTTTPYLCRIGEAPSKINKKIMARFPTVPTEADKVAAKAYMAGKGLL